MSNLTEEKRNEIFELINKEKKENNTPTKELIKDIHQAAVVNQVKTDEETQKKFIKQAKKSVENELESLDQENITRLQKTTYDANKEACNNYGIDASVPLWQIKLMKLGSGFWFVIYWLFASITICPINVFFKGIKAFIKNNYIVFVFAVISYLMIVVGIPLLIKLLNQ